MAGLFAIRGPGNTLGPRKPTLEAEAAAAPSAAAEGGDSRQDDAARRLLKMIPGEAVTFYGVASSAVEGSIPEGAHHSRFVALLLVVLAALALTVLIRRVETRDPATGRPQWWAIGISCLSFVIYCYTMGGPFRHFLFFIPPGWSPTLGLVFSAFWTAATPYLFRAK